MWGREAVAVKRQVQTPMTRWRHRAEVEAGLKWHQWDWMVWGWDVQRFPKLHPHKGIRSTQGEKDHLIDSPGRTGYATQQNEIRPAALILEKQQFTVDQCPPFKMWNSRNARGKCRRCISSHRHSQDCSGQDSSSTGDGPKNNKWDYVRLKCFFTSEKTIIRTSTEWREIFAVLQKKFIYTLNRRLMSTVYKEVNRWKMKQSIEKWDHEMKLTKQETEMDKNIFKSPKHP